MALQFSLQNVLDLAKYALTMGLNKSSQFKWAALASFASVTAACVCYLFYVRQTRGHLVHLEWAEGLLKKKR